MVGTAMSTYCRGRNEEGIAAYLVELTDKHLFSFEMLNSICLLDSYDHLLLTLESRISSGGIIEVPPFDVLMILMTLATVSEHYKEPISRSNDPYNISRGKLSHRSLKILKFYVEALRSYDGKGNDQYEYELLRCQFFIIIDSLISNITYSPRRRMKRQKTNKGVVFKYQLSESDDSESASEPSVSNPYRSYMSCLERKQRILGNLLLSDKLKKPGEFINMILWTLSTSLHDDAASYIASHDVWMPLLKILVELIVLRHDFYVSFEIPTTGSAELVSQQLSKSPLANFLEVIQAAQSEACFCQRLFLACDYRYEESRGDIEVHPVYHEENILSKTYIPRITYGKTYKLKKTMSLRRDIIGAYFKLLSEVPAGHRLVRPVSDADKLMKVLSGSLANFRDVDEFKAFFITADLSSALYFMPLLAEGTLSYLLCEFHQQIDQKDYERLPLTLIENLDDIGKFLRECTSLFEEGFFVPSQRGLSMGQLENVMKGDICLMVMFQYAIFLNTADAIESDPLFTKFTTAVYRNDKRRRKAIAGGNVERALPHLRPLLLKMVKTETISLH